MNVQDYISSGIIESYVLGLASDEERSEFEDMCGKYPEVLEARIYFEMILEKESKQNALVVPPDVKEKILSRIPTSTNYITTSPTPIVKMGWLKFAVAACLILLAGSLYWNISLYNKNKKLQDNFDNTLAKLNNMEKDYRILQQNPNVKMAAMTGMEVSPKSLATVYWDTTSKDVYLLINNLPKPANDKQYQLWALLNGKPIDAGMIDNKYFIQQNKLLLQMKNMQSAQAFAITLEKKGGNPTPQGAMYVMGKL